MSSTVRLCKPSVPAFLESIDCRLSLAGEDFSYVPNDGDFGANRSLPGFFALGDVSIRIRPADVQRQTLPPLSDLDTYPKWTSLSSGTGDPGTPFRSTLGLSSHE